MTNKHDHWQCGFGMFSFLERLVIVGAQGTQVPSDSSRVTTGIPEPMGHLGVLLQSHHFAASPSPNQCQVLTFTMSQCHGDLGFQWRGWTNRPYPGEGEVWWSRPAYEFPNGGNMTKRYRCFRDVVMLRVPANHSGPDHPDHDLVTWNPWYPMVGDPPWFENTPSHPLVHHHVPIWPLPFLKNVPMFKHSNVQFLFGNTTEDIHIITHQVGFLA